MKMHHLDARRLLCPLPVIRVQDRVKNLSVGDMLEVSCTDPGVMQDIPAWCRINGHRLVSAEGNNGEFTIRLKIGER